MILQLFYAILLVVSFQCVAQEKAENENISLPANITLDDVQAVLKWIDQDQVVLTQRVNAFTQERVPLLWATLRYDHNYELALELLKRGADITVKQQVKHYYKVPSRDETILEYLMSHPLYGDLNQAQRRSIEEKGNSQMKQKYEALNKEKIRLIMNKLLGLSSIEDITQAIKFTKDRLRLEIIPAIPHKGHEELYTAIFNNIALAEQKIADKKREQQLKTNRAEQILILKKIGKLIAQKKNHSKDAALLKELDQQEADLWKEEDTINAQIKALELEMLKTKKLNEK